QESVAGFENGRVGRSQQLESVERLEQSHRVAHAQLGMAMAVTQRHHLREELDVHQTAATLLDVEARLVLGADLIFHPPAHRGYFADLGRGQTAAVNESLARRFDFAAKFRVAGYYARPDQGLALPNRRTLPMIVAETRQRRDQRAGVARRAQAQVELVGVALAGARFEDRDQLLRDSRRDFPAARRDFRAIVIDKDQIEVGVV